MTLVGRKEGVSPFGVRLRGWRIGRGLSQLALADRAGTTARHLSFLETGRSRPSAEMVLRLSEALDVPLRDRNQLLESAGLAAAYREEPVDADALQPFRTAIDRLLQAHEPYPALVVDRHWNVIAANQACSTLFGDGLVGTNMIHSNVKAHETIANWPQVARAALARLQQQLRQAPLDHELQALVEVARGAVAGFRPDHPGGDDLVVCPHFRIGDQVIRTIAITARFDNPLDVTLAELRIELIYPQDQDAERCFRAHAGKEPVLSDAFER